MSRSSLLLISLALCACGSKPAVEAPAAEAPAAEAPAGDAPTCCCEYTESGLENYTMMTAADCSAAQGTCAEATSCSATDE